MENFRSGLRLEVEEITPVLVTYGVDLVYSLSVCDSLGLSVRPSSNPRPRVLALWSEGKIPDVPKTRR